MQRKKSFLNWQAWLELLRLPNLFTVPGDVIVGWVLMGMKGRFPFLAILASLSFYCVGLLLNDLFDVVIDAKERPRRPLPSKRVSKGGVLCVSLFLSGLALGLTAWADALPVGILLLGMILFYNLLAKRIPVVGVVVMGACRGLNILLGAAMAYTWEALPLDAPQLQHAMLFFAVYILIVSIVARNEALPKARTHVAMRLLPLAMVLLLLPLAWYYGKFMWEATLLVALCFLPDLFLQRPIPKRVAGYIRGLIPLQGLWCLMIYPSLEMLWITLFLVLWGGAWVASRRFAGS